MQELLKEQNEKLKELAKHLRLFALTNSTAPFSKQWNDKRKLLESGIAAIEKQIAETKEPALRDELINYVKWQYNKFGIPEGEFSTKNIDEYLNPKQLK